MPANPYAPVVQVMAAAPTTPLEDEVSLTAMEPSGVTRPLYGMEQASPTTPLAPSGLILNEAPPTRPLASATAQEGATWVTPDTHDQQEQPKPRRFWPIPNLLGRRNNGAPPAPRNRE